MNYDAILFDMDGVLVTGYETPAPVYRAAAARTVRAFGKTVADIDDLPALQQPGSAAEFRAVCNRLDIPPEAAWGYRERVASGLAKTRLEQGDRTAFPDTDNLLDFADRYTLGICSNNRHKTVADAIDIFGWTSAVTGYRGRFPTLSDFDQRKPKPAYLQWLITHVDAASPLFIGDRMSDVQTAEEVGCDAALLSREREPEAGPAVPTYHIESLDGLRALEADGWPTAGDQPIRPELSDQ